MNEVLEQISRIGIVPVVKIDRVEDAVPLAAALCNGGLPCAEVTFRTELQQERLPPSERRSRKCCWAQEPC